VLDPEVSEEEGEEAAGSESGSSKGPKETTTIGGQTKRRSAGVEGPNDVELRAVVARWAMKYADSKSVPLGDSEDKVICCRVVPWWRSIMNTMCNRFVEDGP